MADTLSTKLSTVGTLLAGASTTVAAQLARYQTQDQQAAIDFDAQSGVQYGGSDLPTVSNTPVQVSSDLSTMLDAAPPDSVVIPDLFFQLLGILGTGDVKSAMISAAMAIPGLSDLLEHLEKSFAGDWNIANRSANALDQIRAFCNGLADTLNNDRLSVGAEWDGSTADSADYWTRRMVASIDEFDPVLLDVADDFRAVSSGMQSEAAFVATILGELAVLIVVIIAALIAAPETAGASLLAAAGSAAAAVIACNSAVGGCLLAAEMVESFYGVIAKSLGAINAVDRMNDPDTYDIPLVLPR